MEVRHEADEYEARLADVVSVVRDTVRRRWLVLVAVTAAVFVLGVILVSFMTPQYVATAKIRLDPSRNALTSGNAQQARADLSDNSIQTELTQLRSLPIARQVVRTLGLIDDPEFSGAISASSSSPVTNTEARETVVANALLGHVTAEREKETYVLNVTVQSTDPIKAARIANAFAAGYIEYRSSSRIGTAREQSEWFKQQLATLNREAGEAANRAAAYRVRAGIVGSGADGRGGGTIVDQQLGPLSGSLASAASDAAAARASLSAAQAAVARGNYDAVPAVLNSGVVQELRRQRSDALRVQNEITVRYGERHPESVRVQDQVTSLDNQIRAEARRILASMQADAAAANARVDSLRGSMGQLEQQRAQSVTASSEAENLQQEADAKRALYDKMSQMSLESLQASTSQIAVAQLSATAEPPKSPVSPNKPLLYLLSLIVGLAAGGATIAAQELMSGGFRSVEDLERQLGLPVLAVVPKVRKNETPTEVMLDKPTSMFSEAYRIARTAVLGARGETGVQVIAITSSLPAEGKTTSAVAFARTLAIANARVLLLECDVRRASVRHLVRGNAPKVGLVELLHGEISLDEAIQTGDVPNLDQILVVNPYFSAENLFGEGRMEQLLEALRPRYDYIILDLPPLMGLADGRQLAVLADATALVVKWSSTPISAVTSSIGWLRADGAKPVGAIYTQVDPSAHSVGGLYYYSGKYSSYYGAS